MEDRFCFECLERRIQSDFSGGLAFSYGLSDSPLPFGSSAVVQVSPLPVLAPLLIAVDFVVDSLLVSADRL